MLSTLLLQMPTADGLETSSPTLGSMSSETSVPLPEAFASALLAAVAKLSPRPGTGAGADSAHTTAPAGTLDSTAEEPTPSDSLPDPLTLLHTEQVRHQLSDIAWALPAVATPTVTNTVAPSSDSAVAGSRLPPQLPASGSVLPVDQPAQASPSNLDSSAPLATSADVSAAERLNESNLPQTLAASHPAKTSSAPMLTSSLTLQPTTPVSPQPGEPSLAEPRADARALPSGIADERVEKVEQTKQPISGIEMGRSSMGTERAEILPKNTTSTAAAAQFQALVKRDAGAQVPPAPLQMIAAGNAALEKVPTPAISASKRASAREPLAINGSSIETTSVAIQRIEPQSSSAASTIAAAATSVLPPVTSSAPTDGSLFVAQNLPSIGPLETSAASISAPEKSAEGAATQLRVLTLTQTDELGDKLGALLASIKHIGKSQLSIQLHPQELGRLEVRIAPGAEQALNVSITAQQSATRDLVEAHLHRLRSALDDQGYAEVHVEVGQERDSNSGRQQQQQAEEQPIWPLAGTAGQPWRASVPGTQTGVGLEHSQIAALGPGIDAYA